MKIAPREGKPAIAPWAVLAVVAGWVVLAGCRESPSTSVSTTPAAGSGAVATAAPSPVVSAPAPKPVPAPAPVTVPVPVTNMVAVKAGTFQRIKFPVTLTRDFWIGKYEVTQDDYAAVIGRNPSHFSGEGRRPVEKVSFVEASAYCAALTRRETDAGRLPAGYVYRLPFEAEWEYACRAGSTNLFSFGDDAGQAGAFAWTAENSDAATHPVGLKQPNAWGLHDMHGNVWEWCQDWFEPYPARAVTDPVGPSGGKFKVFKGGGWNQDAEYGRSANRFMMSPSNGIHFVGFRIVLAPKTP